MLFAANKFETKTESTSQSESQTKNTSSDSTQTTNNETLVKIATIDTKELGAAINKHNSNESSSQYVFDFNYIKVNKAKTHQILRASASVDSPDAIGGFAVIAYRDLSGGEWKIAITGHQFTDSKDYPISKHVSDEALEVFKDDRFWYTEAEVKANAQKTPDLQ